MAYGIKQTSCNSTFHSGVSYIIRVSGSGTSAIEKQRNVSETNSSRIHTPPHAGCFIDNACQCCQHLHSHYTYLYFFYLLYYIILCIHPHNGNNMFINIHYFIQKRKNLRIVSIITCCNDCFKT